MTSVLVVDDEVGMRETLVDILESAGYEVGFAASGDAALKRLELEDFDVVVMDIRMPGRDGVEVLQTLHAPPPQVILMTAYAVEDRLRDALEANAYAVLQKPFAPPYLLGLVASAAAA